VHPRLRVHKSGRFGVNLGGTAGALALVPNALGARAFYFSKNQRGKRGGGDERSGCDAKNRKKAVPPPRKTMAKPRRRDAHGNRLIKFDEKG
jgi:hypothetical protein